MRTIKDRPTLTLSSHILTMLTKSQSKWSQQVTSTVTCWWSNLVVHGGTVLWFIQVQCWFKSQSFNQGHKKMQMVHNNQRASQTWHTIRIKPGIKPSLWSVSAGYREKHTIHQSDWQHCPWKPASGQQSLPLGVKNVLNWFDGLAHPVMLLTPE